MASTLLHGLATGKPRSNTCAALNYNAGYPTVRRWIPWKKLHPALRVYEPNVEELLGLHLPKRKRDHE